MARLRAVAPSGRSSPLPFNAPGSAYGTKSTLGKHDTTRQTEWVPVVPDVRSFPAAPCSSTERTVSNNKTAPVAVVAPSRVTSRRASLLAMLDLDGGGWTGEDLRALPCESDMGHDTASDNESESEAMPMDVERSEHEHAQESESVPAPSCAIRRAALRLVVVGPASSPLQAALRNADVSSTLGGGLWGRCSSPTPPDTLGNSDKRSVPPRRTRGHRRQGSLATTTSATTTAASATTPPTCFASPSLHAALSPALTPAAHQAAAAASRHGHSLLRPRVRRAGTVGVTASDADTVPGLANESELGSNDVFTTPVLVQGSQPQPSSSLHSPQTAAPISTAHPAERGSCLDSTVASRATAAATLLRRAGVRAGRSQRSVHHNGNTTTATTTPTRSPRGAAFASIAEVSPRPSLEALQLAAVDSDDASDAVATTDMATDDDVPAVETLDILPTTTTTYALPSPLSAPAAKSAKRMPLTYLAPDGVDTEMDTPDSQSLHTGTSLRVAGPYVASFLAGGLAAYALLRR